MRKAVYESQGVAGVIPWAEAQRAPFCSAWQHGSRPGFSHSHPGGPVAASCLQPPPATWLLVPA